MNGQGSYNFENGDWYIRKWKDNKLEGCRYFKWKDGAYYEGEWLNSERDGLGTLMWPSGD